MCLVINRGYTNPFISVQRTDSITERVDFAFFEGCLATTEAPDTVSFGSVHKVVPIINYYRLEGVTGGEDDDDIGVGKLVKESIDGVAEGLVTFFCGGILDVISSMEEAMVVGNNVGVSVGVGAETVNEGFDRKEVTSVVVQSL